MKTNRSHHPTDTSPELIKKKSGRNTARSLTHTVMVSEIVADHNPLISAAVPALWASSIIHCAVSRSLCHWRSQRWGVSRRIVSWRSRNYLDRVEEAENGDIECALELTTGRSRWTEYFIWDETLRRSGHWPRISQRGWARRSEGTQPGDSYSLNTSELSRESIETQFLFTHTISNLTPLQRLTPTWQYYSIEDSTDLRFMKPSSFVKIMKYEMMTRRFNQKC